MDSHVELYFRQFSAKTPDGGFHKVIKLHQSPDISWSEISRIVPTLPRGWFELAEMPTQDRIDFVRDFWLSKLPFCPHILERLDPFFEKLDDIGIYLFQKKYDDVWQAEMVYSIKDNGGFYRGNPPASEEQLYQLQKYFPDTILPEDYMEFLRIHNGFAKATDTGITASYNMIEQFNRFQESLGPDNNVFTTKGIPVNPKSLIPFYESFGMPFFQCFWSEWYPENEMGNVYFSGQAQEISNVECTSPESDQMAFKNFTDWLFFYLETIS